MLCQRASAKSKQHVAHNTVMAQAFRHSTETT
jgi:hypothetical protein